MNGKLSILNENSSLTIGYPFLGKSSFAYNRNIIGIVNNVSYKGVWDLFTIIGGMKILFNRITKKEIFTFKDTLIQFNDFNTNNVNLLHFFNTISYARTPWITTFETLLPCFDCIQTCYNDFSTLKKNKNVQYALEKLSSDSCKVLIALSNCSADYQKELLKEFPKYKTDIERKLIVMHPPQKQLISQFSDKDFDPDGTIKFCFVGADFIRKGGVEVIEAMRQLREKYHYKIELTILSSLRVDDYATTRAGSEDVKRAKQLIQKNAEWIKYIPRLRDYQDVLELMKNSHIGLLPTHADTYGYSVLEFQAAGCPVITTNIRALPEINDNNRGWLIEVPKNSLGEAICTTKKDKVMLSEVIKKGLEQSIHEIFSDKSLLTKKSKASILGIKENHSVDKYSERMRKIYFAERSD
jgi:glycosyltransferase involved in cell wall biosynthesis